MRGCEGGWTAEACLRGGDEGHKDLICRAFCRMAIKFCVQNTPLTLYHRQKHVSNLRRFNSPTTCSGGVSKLLMSVSFLVQMGCKFPDILLVVCVFVISSSAEHYKVLAMMYELGAR